MISGYADTLLFFRSTYPELKGQHSLGKLYEHFIGAKFNAHDACSDVSALLQIMNHCKISNTEIVDYSFCSKWLHAYYKQQTDSRANLATFQQLIR